MKRPDLGIVGLVDLRMASPWVGRILPLLTDKILTPPVNLGERISRIGACDGYYQLWS